MSTAARNVALVSKTWFDDFKKYLLSTSITNPGFCDNTELAKRIDSHTELKYGIDYEILELNVFQLIEQKFLVDPKIFRPYMVNMLTNTGSVILYPIKFQFVSKTNNMNFSKTFDSNWTIVEMKKMLEKSLKVGMDNIVVKSSEEGTVLQDQMDVSSIASEYGNNLYLDITVKKHRDTYDSKSNSTLPNPISYDITSNSVNFSSQIYQSHISILNSLLHSISLLPPIIEYYRNKDTNELNTFGKYVQEVDKFSQAHIPPELFSELIDSKITNSGSSISNIFSNLIKNLGLQQFFQFSLHENIKCKTCKVKIEHNSDYLCISLPIVSKLFKKATLENCIHSWMKSYTTEQHCDFCKAETTTKGKMKILSLPKVAAFAFRRHIKSSNTMKRITDPISFPMDLELAKPDGNGNEKYKLIAVVSQSGQQLNRKYKTFCYDCKAKNWLFFSETRSSICQSPKAIFEKELTWMLLYAKLEDEID
ncbi:inactive ubiquitin carboxyl-terminal hydrolase 50 [Histomonas meleagridis]|uniref:inactive ubiquitin carboxyl-terminal hydrolase 50 n=1 Tax=Histomonas meleagridis TaxID=135588 RepID=UPI00355945F3|nr:inactive ubiquitin carboxyl-terminal hydrolase 50 [Histomonas meleagridis]KAH0803837.1 inactive ubiquitin carboxyl-terminal hydrolase 50 [Histomonas meleagridis]